MVLQMTILMEYMTTLQIYRSGVNLYGLIVHPFKGKGRCMTMDSAYMSDIMAQIGCNEWRMNMVGTAQVNCTGANAKAAVDTMKVTRKGTHKTSVMWQHNTLPLVIAVWAGNAIVTSLSNFILLLTSKKVSNVGVGLMV